MIDERLAKHTTRELAEAVGAQDEDRRLYVVRTDPGYDLGSHPSAAEVRAALDRILVSDALRSSPQLAAFLHFVVELTLRGEGDRIKGYTIATEALGRKSSFDPQTDPIVRVEAVRLRRALERYYRGLGGNDPVVIELPRGSYVPSFRLRRSDK